MSFEERVETETDEDLSRGQVVVIPPPVYTIAILLCVVVAMVAQISAGLEQSILIAGFVKPAVLVDGQYWRILTGAVIHGSFLHVFMNGYALYGFGKLMELLTNRAHVAIVFVLSAVGGGLLSLFFKPDSISVGASGGIIGLLGYLVVYAFRRRRFISAEFRRSLVINIGIILVFGLILYELIDNYGHIGGLLTGIVYGMIQIPSDEYVNPQDAGPVTRVLGLVALGIYVAAAALTVYLLLTIR